MALAKTLCCSLRTCLTSSQSSLKAGLLQDLIKILARHKNRWMIRKRACCQLSLSQLPGRSLIHVHDGGINCTSNMATCLKFHFGICAGFSEVNPCRFSSQITLSLRIKHVAKLCNTSNKSSEFGCHLMKPHLCKCCCGPSHHQRKAWKNPLATRSKQATPHLLLFPVTEVKPLTLSVNAWLARPVQIALTWKLPP